MFLTPWFDTFHFDLACELLLSYPFRGIVPPRPVMSSYCVGLDMPPTRASGLGGLLWCFCMAGFALFPLNVFFLCLLPMTGLSGGGGEDYTDRMGLKAVVRETLKSWSPACLCLSAMASKKFSWTAISSFGFPFTFFVFSLMGRFGTQTLRSAVSSLDRFKGFFFFLRKPLEIGSAGYE